MEKDITLLASLRQPKHVLLALQLQHEGQIMEVLHYLVLVSLAFVRSKQLLKAVTMLSCAEGT